MPSTNIIGYCKRCIYDASLLANAMQLHGQVWSEDGQMSPVTIDVMPGRLVQMWEDAGLQQQTATSAGHPVGVLAVTMVDGNLLCEGHALQAMLP
jgi:hypothetical protein